MEMKMKIYYLNLNILHVRSVHFSTFKFPVNA